MVWPLLAQCGDYRIAGVAFHWFMRLQTEKRAAALEAASLTSDSGWPMIGATAVQLVADQLGSFLGGEGQPLQSPGPPARGLMVARGTWESLTSIPPVCLG